MRNLTLTTSPKVQEKFQSYPSEIRPKMEFLRNLILETAQELDAVQTLEETLKWGEPSYVSKKGSTIRMDWKPRAPNQYALYFKCTSLLVRTFQEVYGDLFKYEKTRAILFDLEDEVPKKALKKCIGAALEYHSVKKMPQLDL